MFLSELVAKACERVENLRQQPNRVLVAAAEVAPARSLANALQASAPMGVIAECKQRSPSKGQIATHYDPVAQARYYEQVGASAISVLTEPYFFGGALSHLEAVRHTVAIPVLRKDFILDPLQVVEAKAAGADAILLIVRIVPDAGLRREIFQTAQHYGMEVLVEVHAPAEVEAAMALDPPLLGVNNRDLDTFVTRLEFSREIRACMGPGPLLVSESGIQSLEDVIAIRDWGYGAILVGESLMRGGRLLEDVAAWRKR